LYGATTAVATSSSNAKVMTDVIDVETDQAAVRQSFNLVVDRACDLHSVREAISAALAGADGVLAAPPPDAIVVDIVDGDPLLACRFWAGSTRAAATNARDAAITAVLARLVADGVPTPITESRVVVTTDADGTPSQQPRSNTH
jgi:small-conductance mechanosensitive channel